MNIAELIKFQVLQRTVGMGGSSGTHSHSDGSEQSMYEIFQQMFTQCATFAIISLVDQGSKLLPELLHAFRRRQESKVASLTKMYSDPVEPLLKNKSLLSDARHAVNTIILSRDYDKKNTDLALKKTNEYVDAVLDAVSRLRNVPSMILTDHVQFLVNYKEKPIQLSNEIFFQLIRIDWGDNYISPLRVNISLNSNSLTATQMIEYVQDLHSTFIANQTNSLGNKLYFFNQIDKPNMNISFDPRGDPAVAIDYSKQNYEKRRTAVNQASPTLTFTKVPFFSSKSFENICGPEAREVRQRVEFFIKNKDWYMSKGIPYTLGMLLSGVPGSGKTSILRAIANLTGRHIINVNFASIKTSKQLNNLFTSEELTYVTDESFSPTRVNIPISKRLYVLEEIDALGGIVLDRGEVTINSNVPVIDGELTLADILTVLDGTVEMPDRMLIITSNYPEKLDKALIRPGRIDLSMNFGNAVADTIREMTELFFSRKMDPQYNAKLPENLTCAEISFVLFANLPDTSDEHLISEFQAMSRKKIEDELIRKRNYESMKEKMRKKRKKINQPETEIKQEIKTIMSEKPEFDTWSKLLPVFEEDEMASFVP